MEKIKEIEEINLQKEYIEKVKKINENKNLKYSILTMGCQLNENDSEKLCGMLEEMGYTKTENQKEAWRIEKNKRRTWNYNSNWWLHDARKTYNR